MCMTKAQAGSHSKPRLVEFSSFPWIWLQVGYKRTVRGVRINDSQGERDWRLKNAEANAVTGFMRMWIHVCTKWSSLFGTYRCAKEAPRVWTERGRSKYPTAQREYVWDEPIGGCLGQVMNRTMNGMRPKAPRTIHQRTEDFPWKIRANCEEKWRNFNPNWTITNPICWRTAVRHCLSRVRLTRLLVRSQSWQEGHRNDNIHWFSLSE